MKNLTLTKTGNVHRFTSISEEAGNNQGEAYDILEQLCDLEENGVTGVHAWADLMVDDKYETIIAIAAEDALTCWDANVVFVELEEQEYPEFYKAMREFHDTKKMKTIDKVDKAKEIIYQSDRVYLNGCDIDSIPENYEVTEGTGLGFSDLVHPSGNNVSDMLDELFGEGGWDVEATKLQQYECKCYAEMYSTICEEQMGGLWDYVWSNEEIAPYSRCPGAWVVAKITND
jgi:hypothetical protein